METKHLIGLTLMLAAIPLSVAVCCLSERAREAAFVLMIVGTTLTEKLQINFFSHYWYRGTTRGFEFTFIDILAIGVLVSALLARRERLGPRGNSGLPPEVGVPPLPRCFWPASLGVMLLYFFYGCFSVAISEP